MRMLMNNLDPEVAEHPDQLIVYGGSGRAARSWEAYAAIVSTLQGLKDDETLLVQSGKPVGVLRTHEWAPRVLIANSNLVPQWATWEEFRRLEQLGLTMYGQMTAGSWIYIGTQGILQGTYETFAAVAAKRFGGTLAGHDHADRRARRHGRRAAAGRHHERRRGHLRGLRSSPGSAAGSSTATSTSRPRTLADAIRRAIAARDKGVPLSIGLLGNAADIFADLLASGAPIDIVTDQTSAHDPLTYLPQGVAFEDMAALRAEDPGGFTRRARESMAVHVAAMVGFMDAGAEVFDYGNSIRGEAELAGYTRAFDFPGFVPAYIRPLFCEGKGPVPLGRAVRRPEGHRRHRPGHPRPVPAERGAGPVDQAGRGEGPLPGAPGPDLLARLRRAAPGRACASTTWSTNGEVSAPIVLGRDHLDCGSVASPYRETEAMADGSDAIADWPLLNALVNTASGASWVSIHHGGGVGIGRSIHAGQVCVADGTRAGRRRNSSGS